MTWLELLARVDHAQRSRQTAKAGKKRRDEIPEVPDELHVGYNKIAFTLCFVSRNETLRMSSSSSVAEQIFKVLQCMAVPAHNEIQLHETST